MKVKTLYESDNYIIVDKPYDMYINSDDKNETNTVAYHIASHDSHTASSVNPLHFTHRLDYSTSGVLCIAKNKRSAATVGKLFEKRLAKKYYLALVRGHVLNDTVINMDCEIGEDTRTDATNHKMLAVTAPQSRAVARHCRRASTRALALEWGRYDGEPATVVLLKPHTGRRHQLRVQCTELGHTIVGDYTYSDGLDVRPHRMFLHAIRLVLPLDDEPLDIQTEIPFFDDDTFMSKWESEKKSWDYRTSEEFRLVCNDIDDTSVTSDKTFQ